MNRKSIFKYLQENLVDNKDIYDFVVLEDQLYITREVEDSIKYTISIRCQKFGDIYLLNLPVNLIRIEKLEYQFEAFLFDDLKKYYDDDFTLCVGAISLDQNSITSEFRITSESDLNVYCKELKEYIREAEKVFFYPMGEIKNLAEYISQFTYENNLKVLVGGRFPVHTFKKLFLLYKGSQLERYFEYKEGLYKQIKDFQIRKPQRKEEAEIFIDNYNYFIKELEKGNSIIRIV